MKITGLRIDGFKSFADRIEIPIPEGLTGVVGPNGCGKSNVLESLRWAMGETSAKNMRGGSMDDVIFSGTEKRPARNVCEVGIVMDNSDRGAPAEFNDSDVLEIVRRIERGQGGLYKINGRVGRLRDTQLIFKDAGSGPRSASMVSQGRVSAIISAKPADRRSVLEDAAGIAGMHVRRHESELKLNAAEQNLTRAEDSRQGLEQSIRSLRAQASAARRWKEIDEDIKRAERDVSRLRFRAASDILAQANRLHEVNEKELLDALAKAQEIERGLASGQIAIREAAETRASLEKIYLEALAVRDRYASDMRRAAENLAVLKQRIAEYRADLERATAEVASGEARQVALRDERLAISAIQEEEDARLEEVSDATDRSDRELSDAMTILAQKKAVLADIATRRKDVEARLASAVGRLTATQTRHREETARIEAEDRRIAAYDLPSMEAAAEDLRAGIEEANARIEEALASRSDIEEHLGNARRRLDDLRAEVSSLESERKVLERQVEGSAGIGAGLLVDPGFENMVAAVFGSFIEAGLDPGEVQFWAEPIAAESPGAPDLPRLIDKVPFAPGGRAALARIYLVEHEGDAEAILSRVGPGGGVIALDSEMFFRWDGYRARVSAEGHVAIRLRAKARLTSIEDRIPHVAEALRSAEDDFSRTSVRLKALLDGLKTDEEAVRTDRGSLSGLETRIAAARTDIESTRMKLSSMRDVMRVIDEDMRILEREKETAEGLLDEIGSPDDVAEAVRIAEGALAAARRRNDEDRRRMADEIAAQTGRRNRKTEIVREEADLASRMRSAVEQSTQVQERLARVEAEAEVLSAERERQQGDESGSALEAAVAEAKENLDRVSVKLQGLQDQATRNDVLLEGVRATTAKCRELQPQRVSDIRAAQEDLQRVTIAIRDQYGEDAERFFSGDGSDDPNRSKDVRSAEERLARLNRERDTLGSVNLLAADQLDEAEKQKALIDQSLGEIKDSVAALRKAIADINREAKQKLDAAFVKIDTGFKDLFRRLFGGGHAHLKLVGGEDPLECGLEIYASPPGKKMQSLSLLSGGEQALTALSLIFAAFLTSPAPICVLDEVDAPLDDANVERLCGLLRELADEGVTRFLVVTHHALTMSRMDRLYGVTMAERGVSRLAAVDLDSAEKMVEAA